jgi:hypothetical protein
MIQNSCIIERDKLGGSEKKEALLQAEALASSVEDLQIHQFQEKKSPTYFSVSLQSPL